MLKHSLLVSCNLVSTPFLNAMAASHSLLFSPPFFCFLHLPPQGSQSDAGGVDRVHPDCFDFDARDLEVCVCPSQLRRSADVPSRIEAIIELLHGGSLWCRLSLAESQRSCWTGCPLTAPGPDITCLIAIAAIELGIWYCISVEHCSIGVFCSLTQCGCTCMIIVHNLCIACNYAVIYLKSSFLVWEFDFLNFIHRGHASSEKAAHHSWRHELLHWVYFMESAHRHWGKCEF